MKAQHLRMAGTGLKLTGAALAVGLIATACSSSGSSGAAAPAASTSRSAAASGNVTINVRSGALGTYLTDSAGKTLYMFASDSATKSTCSGACATYWPPVTTTGTAHGSGAAAGGTFTTITRSDGSKQVVFDGHPLYYFKLDTKAGDTNGQGSSNFGAKWWVLAPSGTKITTTGAAAGSSSGGSGTGGY